MTRDGHKAVDGIAKSALGLANNPFSGLNASAFVTAMATSKKKGTVVVVGLYNDGLGVGATTIQFQLWNKDPTVIGSVNEGINKIYSIDISAFPASADWILRKAVFVPFQNSDSPQKNQIYARVLITAGVVTTAYSGRLQADTEEAE